jgi:hypothetical protein
MTQGKWKCHTPKLLDEVLNRNENMSIFSAPFSIFGKLLAEVAERASELNDPELNDLMCRLTLYEVADPYSAEHDPEALKEVRRLADLAKAEKEARN